MFETWFVRVVSRLIWVGVVTEAKDCLMCFWDALIYQRYIASQ